MRLNLKRFGAMPLLLGALALIEMPVQTQAAAPAKPQGKISVREFVGMPGVAIDALTSDPKFPDSPDIKTTSRRFEWPTGPNDTTAPAADVKNNYGVQIIGYLYPPTTADYTFALAADDNAVLYLSTDDNPANKVEIATEPQWNPVRAFAATTRRPGCPDACENVTAAPIHLEAGKAYYIEALMKEEGGGDNLAVAWTSDGTKPADGAVPIRGIYLATIDEATPTDPAVLDFSGDVSGFTYTLADGSGAGGAVNTGSIQAQLDGAPVTVTSSAASGFTTIRYQAPQSLASGSSHTVNLTFTDSSTPAKTFTDQKTFQVVNYKTIAPDSKVTADTTKPGFSILTYAVTEGLPTTIVAAEQALAGERMGADGTVLPNDADLSLAAADGRFVHEGVINFNQDAPAAAGNFTVDNGKEDQPVPGIPTLSGGTDNYAQELITFLELPAGYVTMGFNSDDGFKTTAGAGEDVFTPVLGSFNGGRGAADTIFSFNVVEAGVYAFRTIWYEGGGGSNAEWFTVKEDGTKVLVNDTANGGLKAYRAIQAGGTLKAVVRKVTPAIGAGGVPNDVTISAEIVDGSTPISGGTLTLDGAPVQATVTKAGNVTTVSYKNTTTFAEASTHTVTLQYTDGTTPITREWKFSAPSRYLLAWWDFNDASDPTRTVDKISSAVGTFENGAKLTDAGQGRTGQGTDRAARTGDDDPVVNGYIRVDANNAKFLNDGGIQNQLAISLWQRLDVIKNSSVFWTLGEGQDRAFQAHTPWGDSTVYFDTGGGCCDDTMRISKNLSEHPTGGGDPAVFLAEWRHFVLQKNGDNKQIWIDGELFHEGVNNSPLPFVFTLLTIGSDSGGGNNTHGEIDDFAVFASALTEAEIGQLFSGTAPDQVRPPKPGGPVGGDSEFTAVTVSGGNVTITWTGTGVLQSADSITGPWTDVAGASTPFSAPATGAGKFYRFKP